MIQDSYNQYKTDLVTNQLSTHYRVPPEYALTSEIVAYHICAYSPIRITTLLCVDTFKNDFSLSSLEAERIQWYSEQQEINDKQRFYTVTH